MNLINKFVEYLRSSKHELTKVTWPSRQETIRYSTLVITISLAIAAFFGLLDMGLSRLMNATLVKQGAQLQQQVPTERPAVPTTAPLDAEGGTTEQPVFDFGDIEVEATDVETGGGDVTIETLPESSDQ
ncbi:MAG: preprotein translocase subunit SecE [Patescibacteria group bacterium]